MNARERFSLRSMLYRCTHGWPLPFRCRRLASQCSCTSNSLLPRRWHPEQHPRRQKRRPRRLNDDLMVHRTSFVRCVLSRVIWIVFSTEMNSIWTRSRHLCLSNSIESEADDGFSSSVRTGEKFSLSFSLSFITDRSMKIGCGHCFQSDSNERSIRGYRYFEKSFGWSRSREGDSKINLGKSWTSSNRSTIFALMKVSSHLNDTRMQRWLESIVELVRSIISASDPMPACCWSTFSAF